MAAAAFQINFNSGKKKCSSVLHVCLSVLASFFLSSVIQFSLSLSVSEIILSEKMKKERNIHISPMLKKINSYFVSKKTKASIKIYQYSNMGT